MIKNKKKEKEKKKEEKSSSHTKKSNKWPAFVTFTFTYPLIAGVIGAAQMTSQPAASIFLCSPLPSGTLLRLLHYPSDECSSLLVDPYHN